MIYLLEQNRFFITHNSDHRIKGDFDADEPISIRRYLDLTTGTEIIMGTPAHSLAAAAGMRKNSNTASQ